jgi:hypothetical protein
MITFWVHSDKQDRQLAKASLQVGSNNPSSWSSYLMESLPGSVGDQ